ncbi:MAG: hypothetical protein MRK00_16360 [Nitrosomonas sp.]|nr:hypothetical protein [Nitrosomonas sp.]
MDQIDIANEREQMDTQRAIENARKLHKAAEATGHCLFCGDDVEDGVRWCSPECRDDWEVRQ